MAKIVLSADAPEDVSVFYFGNDVIELDASTKSFETDDSRLILEANAHPWLAVEHKTSKRKAPAPAPTPTTEDKG